MSVFSMLTLLFSLLTLLGVGYLFTRSLEKLKSSRPMQLGVVTLSAVALYKLIAFATIVIFPVAAAGSAHMELLEGAKEVDACGKCHVMTPMVTDMRNPESDSLAARHFKNGYITEQQCYHCHSGYGLNGAMAAKLEGYRHLVRYTSGLYEEPIKMRASFDTASCLNCHAGRTGFMKINSHHVAGERLASGQMSCTNCHGPAHPTRTERTPGSPLYDSLMGRAHSTRQGQEK